MRTQRTTPWIGLLRSLAFALLFVSACSPDPEASAAPSVSPDAASSDGAPKPSLNLLRCNTDANCTGRWTPQYTGCGPLERCFESQCLMPPTITGIPNAETGQITFEGADGERSFQVELVQSRFETARGLMCRETMKPDWGMLFFMASTRVQSFWMKNTLTALDIIFIADDWTVVGVAADAQPQTLSARTVGKPSRYVLELKAGVAAAAGIRAGVQARFYPPRPSEP